jgi:2-keto-4-pentenoate hydratase/2-oxohepta-3-ene-1,7-dioic acid hydratase in catechol pathway|tara:strand:- start:1410 stop:2267 length:858 start_codon:yes stop_codon:yes gene_type:complete
LKLIRFGKAGHEKPGLYIDENTILDLSGFGEDYDEGFFEEDGLIRLQNWVDQNKKSQIKINPDTRIGPPVCRPSKIICIGLNFSDHAKESGLEPPTEPVIFFKSTTSICGPYDDFVIPKNATKTDWEVELALVIGKKAKYVPEKGVSDYIAGYLLHNDYSEREYQLEREGQWVKGKSCDTFAPLGPYLVTKDEIKDINNLNMWLKVNGNYMQQGNTRNFIFQIPFIVSYITHFMTLLPGDIISTGTPPGVGLGMNPPRFLKPGDVVELGIDSLGFSKQQVVSQSI